MPYFVIEPWTFPLSFGSFVDQYTVYKNVSLVEGGAENFKCVDENVDYRFVSIHRIQNLTYIEKVETDGKTVENNKTVSKEDLLKLQEKHK